MAFWKKRSGTFEPSNFGSKNCKYGAYYLGKMQMDGVESGFDCTMKTAQQMYKNYKQTKGKNAQRMAVTVIREGITMVEEGTENGDVNSLLPVVDISFGTAVPGHDKLFVVVVRSGDPSAENYTWLLHGFLCDTAANARDLTLLLVKAFQRASAAGEITQPTSVDEASKQSKPTTLHILHEQGRLDHQRLQRTKSAPAVSTIRVTLNVEYKKQPEVIPQPKPKSKSFRSKGKTKEYVDPNKVFAEALAKRDRERGIGLIDVDKSLPKKRESVQDSSTASHVPLRRAKSDSEALVAGKEQITADKENLDISSESEKDNASENGSVHNSSSEYESEQEIVVAINPLMSILKNPSRPLREGGTTTVAFKGELSSGDEEGMKIKTVRFSEEFAIIDG